MEIYKHISALVNYALRKNLLNKDDRAYAINKILDLLNLDEYEETNITKDVQYTSELLEPILDYASEQGLIEPNTVTMRDIFDAKIMDALMPRPSAVRNSFFRNLQVDKTLATTEYYKLAINSNYIRKDRTDRNIVYKGKSKYGLLDITINISKPEKDPRDIIAAKNQKNNYPSCLLCVENEGYRGTVTHPGRANHRIIPLDLYDEVWYLQYSPYVYYNEHCIIFDEKHREMKITSKTFDLMLEFVSKLNHYFIGSNADLPIVGGSILSHNHFQGGEYDFPMARAAIDKTYDVWGVLGVKVERLNWPMSVIRVSGKDYKTVANCSNRIYEKWKTYSDEDVEILCETDETPHNTVTPIARFKDGFYQCDVVLRNNRTSEEHPMGIFHPHKDIHHIKKENIGLIEVMGLAVLPSRLEKEIEYIKDYILNGNSEQQSELEEHLPWIEDMKNRNYFSKENIDEIIKLEICKKFERGLEDAGVFKRNNKGLTAFDKFVATL